MHLWALPTGKPNISHSQAFLLLTSILKGIRFFFFLSFYMIHDSNNCSCLIHSLVYSFDACRRRHADVVEWAWFVNSYGDDGVYQQLMNGDKDSFLLAFALANKITEYYQVILPQSWAHASACCSISSYVQQAADATAWLRSFLLLLCILQVTALLLHIRSVCKVGTPWQ